MTQTNDNQAWFGPLFRLTGYCLLALSIVDLLNLFIPPRFTDPVWELQLANQLVDRTPVPLLGLVLLLIGEQNFRIFKFLSWASCVAGLLFLLLMPFSVSAAWRVAQQGELQSAAQSQRTTQIQQLKTQLNQAQTPEQITQVLSRLNPQNTPVKINNPQQVKQQVLSKLAEAEQAANQQAANRANSNFALIKNAVKLVLGSLISGTVFLIIWRRTQNVLKASKKSRA